MITRKHMESARKRLLLGYKKNKKGCWIWQGCQVGRYGQIRVGGTDAISWSTHRLAYHLLVAPVRKSQNVTHTCGNGLCVNPKHLEALGRKKHLLRCGKERREKAYAMPRCPKGHRWKDNWYVDTSGHRRCRACIQAAHRRWQDANPERYKEIQLKATRRYLLKKRREARAS